jgi:chromatin remodeling complex protein RSC6
MESINGNLTVVLQELLNRIATLETKMTRQEKMTRKIKRDMIPEDQRVPRKPSGFAKATYMSPTLCEFLGVPEGTEMARTEVTKKVLAYVKEKDLQNPESKRVIRLDAKLEKLLCPEKDEMVTYFSIQRLMKVHYIKPELEKTEVEVPAPALSAVPAPALSAVPAPAHSAVPAPALSAVPVPALSAVPAPALSVPAPAKKATKKK